MVRPLKTAHRYPGRPSLLRRAGGFTLAAMAALGALALISQPVLGAEAPSDSGAEAAAREFDIAAGSLAEALRQYAEQSGDQVVFYSDIGRGRESAPVRGRYTREEALRKLLENTGLVAQRLNSKTVAIRAETPVRSVSDKRPPSLAPYRLAQAPAAPQTAGRASRSYSPTPPAALFGMEEVIVTGTAVATRTKFESSVAISTFDIEDIAQQAPKSSAELIAAVPGFWVESTSGTTQGNVFARGIIQDGGYRYVGLTEDGIPLYPVFELSFYNPDQFVRIDKTIERVEAVRGGTAPIFTAGAVGGTINFVTRRPSPVPEATLELGLSDYGSYRTDLSWTGPIAAGWRGAFGGYLRASEGVRDPGYTADEGGQLRLNIGRAFASGELELFAKYIDDRSLFVVPIPLTGDPSDPRGVAGADAGTYSLHSEDLARAGLPPSAAEVGLEDSSLEDGIHPQVATFGARLAWQPAGPVALTNLVRYTTGEVRFNGLFPENAPVTGEEFAASHGVSPAYTVLATGASYPASALVQNHGYWVVNKKFEALQNDLRLHYAPGGHQLTFGLYLADYSMSDRWSLGNRLLMDVSDRPRRLALPGVTDPDGFTQYSFMNLLADYEATQYALYWADEWQATGRLRIDLGMRYDSEQLDGSISEGLIVDLDGDASTPWDNQTSLAGPRRRRVEADFDNFAVSLGLNYELSPRHAVFAHYTDAAKLPSFDDVRNGLTVKDRVTNLELGYKTSLDRFVLFATLFQTAFDNVPFQDIAAGGTTIVRRAQTRTRGLELEGELQPSPELNVRFSITRQDPEYRAFTGALLDNTGNTIRRIPKTMVRVTPTLSLLDARCRVYLTYTYAGQRFANDENTIRLPAYHKLDAGVMFDLGDRWTLQLSGDNLTDEIGLTEANPRTDVHAGAIGPLYMARPLFGRSFMGSVTYKY
ncbi:MAG TPA: TonB-dependent receptor [Steroidobacteraceae bacterium]